MAIVQGFLIMRLVDDHVSAMVELAAEKHRAAIAAVSERPLSRSRLVSALSDLEDALLLAEDAASWMPAPELDSALASLATQRDHVAMALAALPEANSAPPKMARFLPWAIVAVLLLWAVLQSA
jgi:hypothetical protein